MRNHPPAATVQCPRCGKNVEPVDGEYARHYAGRELCVGSKREIVVQKDQDEDR